MVNQSNIENLDKAIDNNQSVSRRNVDRRKHIRRHLDLPILFLTPDRVEHTGRLYDISAGGMRIKSEVIPSYTDFIIIYIDGIGRFEGKFTRAAEGGFSVQMVLNPAKILRMERSINSYFQNYAKDAPISTRRKDVSERRAHRRLACDSQGDIIAITDDGDEFRCNIINMSLGGLEISTAATLQLGQKIKIGTALGRVSRKTTIGYAVIRI